MRTALRTAVALVVLGAAGYAAYRYFSKVESVGKSGGLPRELLHLERETETRRGKHGQVFISAHTQNDLLYVQGFLHGRKAGDQLDALRQWFRGAAPPSLPKDLRAAASLFYYLDLEDLAERCESQYDAPTLAALQKYADGLSAGATAAAPWRARDIVLLQRGYAFLMGTAFVKEWAADRMIKAVGRGAFRQIADYEPTDLEKLGASVQLAPELNGLFRSAPLETVRLIEGRDAIALHVRARPFFSFVFEPTVLELKDAYRAQGLALVGQPLLWSGETGALRFIAQPALVDDERFNLVSRNLYLGRDSALFRNADATAAGAYPEPPTHGPEGRRVTPLFGGLPAGSELFYDWEGFRPSADLTAAFMLVRAQSLDEAVDASRRRQAPPLEWTFRAPSGTLVNYRTRPVDPRDQGRARDYRTARLEVARGAPRVRGLHFQHNRAISVTGHDGEPGNTSPIDRQLLALLRYYAAAEGSGPDWQRDARALLERPGPKRDYFLRLVWAGLLARTAAEAFEDDAQASAAAALNLAFKRHTLNTLERGGSANQWTRGSRETRGRLVADVMRQAYESWAKAAAGQPPFAYRAAVRADAERAVSCPFGGYSTDAAMGPAFTENGPQIAQIGVFLAIWSNDFHVWAYPYDGSRFRKPVRTSPSTGVSVTIQPKI